MADSFLAAMTPLGVREECIHKSPSSRFPWGERGKCLWDFSVFWQNDVFRFSVRRWILGSSRLRERFLHSGAVKVLPNEENAPALCLQETYLR